MKSATHPPGPWLLGLACLGLVAVSACPYAGGWNDGSRLAAVESLADRHTLTIDDSIFCQPPSPQPSPTGGEGRVRGNRGCPPYAPHNADLLTHGTRDKLLIGGHFYSDKPPLISLLMAGLYQGARWLGLPAAAERPDLFCRLLTLTTSGLAYLLTVLALYRLGRLVGLPAGTLLAWLASFALATFALTYTQHVNNHIMLLAVVALACLQSAQLVRARPRDEKNVDHSLREWTGALAERVPYTPSFRASWGRLAVLGLLGGLGYNLDLGSGPLLLAALLLFVLCQTRRPAAVLVVLAAALPWVVACHAFNYAIGGVWKPMNMVAEYSVWPGSPFTPDNLTGFARHDLLKLPRYSLALMLGKHGFLTHNLPLMLAVAGLAVGLRRPSLHRPVLILGLGWCVATWLMYAVLSNNYGGACCSVRWFVPFLAPGYYLLAVVLQRCPQYRVDFLVLSAWGVVLGALMWWQGPWTPRVTPLLWPVVGAALLSWLAVWYRRQARAGDPCSRARSASDDVCS
ncbi:MAG: hypothetical protein L0Z62_46745 [Gemmataceae bacterium]|nr:hypothetical protein [Gemmataceae bacterium]